MTANQPAPAPQINPIELQAQVQALTNQLADATKRETSLRTSNQIINDHRMALMAENADLKKQLQPNAVEPTPKKATKKAAPKK